MALRCLARFVGVRRLTEGLAAPRAFSLEIQRKSNIPSTDGIPIYIHDVDQSKLTDFEISKDPIEWSYVERALPASKIVPQPKHFDGPTPSGWIPPRAEAKSLPYFIKRTKNHMMPVYLRIDERGTRKITLIKKIEGDIWKLEEELKKYLIENRPGQNKLIASRINEMSGQIRFRGDHVAYTKKWMEIKGF